MKKSKILAFHIGRGGRFNNPGYLSFIGEKDITNFTEDLFLMEDGEYYDGGNNSVGLTEQDAESGIGRIIIDNNYDTTYTTYIEDLTEDEIRVLLRDCKDYQQELIELGLIEEE